MKYLLSATDLGHEQALEILDTAGTVAMTQLRQVKKLSVLRGETIANLFFEDSIRTRISFKTAARRLSADVINLSAKDSSVSKGEFPKDIALIL